MVRILAVGMRDYKVMGRDQFWVQISEDERNAVMIYYVCTDGRVIPMRKELYPLTSVVSAVEKFNAGYYVEPPVEVENIEALPDYLGKFEILSFGHCKYNPEL